MIPAFFAMASAILISSPVIIMTLTKALWQRATLVGTPGRRASLIAAIPIRVKLDFSIS